MLFDDDFDMNSGGNTDDFLPSGVRTGIEVIQTILGIILKADDIDNQNNNGSSGDDFI